MAPRSISLSSKTPRRQRAKNNASRRIQKTRKPSTFSKSARLQAKGSPNSLTAGATLLECLQDPSEPPKDLWEALLGRRRKRLDNPENMCPGKRRRAAQQAVSEQLTGGDVRNPLNSQKGSMDDASTPSGHSRRGRRKIDGVQSPTASQPSGRSRRGRRKTHGVQSRTASQPSTASQSSSNPGTNSLRSRKSNTSSNYRYVILRSVGIRIRGGPPPEEIQNHIDAIIKRASLEREVSSVSVADIGKELCDRFTHVIEGAAGDDDCVEPLHQALSSMDQLGRLTFPRKADWRKCLKPRIQPRTRATWDLSLLDEGQIGLADPTVPQITQQPTVENYPSPRTSGSTTIGNRNGTDGALRNEVIPPTPPLLLQAGLQVDPENDSSFVKTPRPSVTIGIRNDVLFQKLQVHNLQGTAAEEFLQYLQDNMTNRNGQHEPALSSEPTQPALNIQFPFLIVEGKSHATGKPIFEAENQAAVAGSCALKILLDHWIRSRECGRSH